MADFSLIEWTDATWNPLLGCDKCSEGCKFCYAIRTAWRLQHNPNPTLAKAYDGLVEQRQDGSLNWTGRINLLPERLREPMRWRRPRRIFVNSQSDLFHAEVPDEFIDQVFTVMALCPQHTFQILTKRPDRMQKYLSAPERMDAIYAQWYGFSGSTPEVAAWPLPNVWLGTSVENQRVARERILPLLDTPAAVRFLSCEPLLGALDLTEFYFSALAGGRYPFPYLGREHRTKIIEMLDWVICGGESGPNARPMHPDWARSLRDQCQASGVPFLFKQWGEWMPAEIFAPNRFQVSTPVENPGPRKPDFLHWKDLYPGDESISARVGKKAAGRLLDGREWNEFPAVGSEVAA